VFILRFLSEVNHFLAQLLATGAAIFHELMDRQKKIQNYKNATNLSVNIKGYFKNMFFKHNTMINF
jgi:hypothetical protein